MQTILKTLVAALLLSGAYALGYGYRNIHDPIPTKLRITVDGGEGRMEIPAIAPGDILTVGAREVIVRNETAPDPEARFPHEYGTPCPLKADDPVRTVAKNGDTVLLELIDKSDGGMYQAGDRIVQRIMEPEVSRTITYCPVKTLFLLDKRHVELERVRYLSERASRFRQQQIDQGERSLVKDMLQGAKGS